MNVEVPPMVRINLHPLQDQEEERRPNSNGIILPWRLPEHERPADQHGYRDQSQIADAAQPAIRCKGVQEGIVRVLGKDTPEDRGPKPVRQVEQQRDRTTLVAEAASLALIVILIERGAHLECRANFIELQCSQQQADEKADAEQADKDDPDP